MPARRTDDDRVARISGDPAALLTDVSGLLAASLSLDELLERIPRLPVPALADWCTIHLLDESGEIERSSGAHADPKREPLIAELHERFPAHRRQKGLVAKALRSGESRLLEQLDDPTLEAYTEDPDQRDLLRRLGVASSIAVPLVARGRTIGVVALLRGSADHPYGPADVPVAEEFARRIALGIDNARLFAEVRDTERRLRALVEGLDAVLWEGDATTGGYRFVSGRAEQLLGYPAAAWTDDPEFWPSILVGDDADAVTAAFRRALDGQLPGDLEYRARTADGRIVWLRQTFAADGGGPVRGLILDDTDRRQAEVRREVEHTVSRVLAEALTLPQAMSEILEGVCRVLGADAGDLWIVDEQAGLLRFVEMWHRDETPTAFREASGPAVFERGSGLPGRVWRSGEAGWIDDVTTDPNFPRAAEADLAGLHGATAFPVTARGCVLGVMCVYSRAVTIPDDDLLRSMTAIGAQIGQFIERRRTEIALRDSEARKAAILDAALDAVITVDDHGRVLEMNAAAGSTFGYREADAIGRELADLIVPEHLRESHRAGLRRFRESGRTSIVGQRLEMPAVRADGTPLDIELAISRVDLPDGTAFTGYIRDVSERRQAEEQLAFGRALLASQSEATLDGILVTSGEGRILYTNARFRELWNVPDDLADGAADWEVLGHVLGQLAEPQAFLERLQRLSTRPDLELRDPIALADGRIFDRWTTPLRDADGAVLGRAWYFRDITAQRQAERNLEQGRERAAFLARASERLTTSLDAEQIIADVVDVAVPAIADVCAIDLVEPDGTVVRRAVSCQEPGRPKEVAQLRVPILTQADPVHGVLRVIRSGRHQLHRDPDDGLRTAFAHDEGFVDVLRRTEVASILSVPLTARGRTLGAVTVAGRAPYEDSHRDLLEEYAARLGLALDNARLYAERTHVAQTLQQSLLPPHVPEVPGLEVAARYHPAGEGSEVGGDFYDIFQRSNRSWGLAIGDVCGKGAGAAVLTALARYTVRAAAMEAWRPSRILHRLNEAILRNPVDDRFCSVLYAVVEPEGRTARVTLASGGHPLPLVLRRDGAIEKAGRSGTVLGLFEAPEVHDTTIDLGPGDALVLYTDGVIEGRGLTTTFGEDMLVTLLGWYANLNAAAIAERVERTVVDFQNGKPSDDIAILVLRVPPA